METAEKVTNETSGREDEKPSVACTVMDVSAQQQQNGSDSSGGSASRSGSSVARSGSGS